MAYNAAGQVTQLPLGSDVYPYNRSYTYNSIGNLLSKTGTGSYAYNDAAHKHAVTHIDGVQRCWYDANGNMTTRIEGGVTYAQTFDAENRLVSATAGGQTTAFTYDGDGQRVKKVDAGGTTYYVGGYYEVKSGVVTKYYYLGGQRVAMRANGVLYYLHGDHLGSTSLTTTQGGGLYAEQRYYPYGELRWSSGTLPTDYRFTGQREESGIKLYDYRARFYSPYLARFISPDTLVPGMGGQALNRYMYVSGNPLRYTDPTGHWEFEERDNPTRPDMLPDMHSLILYRDTFECPFSGYRKVTWSFGSNHNGQDIGGTFSVYTPAAGVITKAGKDDYAGLLRFVDANDNPKYLGYKSETDKTQIIDDQKKLGWTQVECPSCSTTQGTAIHIDHGNGIVTVYYHVQYPLDENNEPVLKVGMKVNQGQSLGTTANIGASRGAHLHFTVKVNGRVVNPRVNELYPGPGPIAYGNLRHRRGGPVP